MGVPYQPHVRRALSLSVLQGAKQLKCAPDHYLQNVNANQWNVGTTLAVNAQRERVVTGFVLLPHLQQPIQIQLKARACAKEHILEKKPVNWKWRTINNQHRMEMEKEQQPQY